jgi:3-amino-4-hydroxybenzoic acid synthase
MTDSRLCWLDIRSTGGGTAAAVEEALHQGIDAVVTDDPAALEPLPPTIG